MLGQILDGRYQIKQTLGAGGFGQTYLAIDTRRPGQPLCVVKHLQPVSQDPQALQTARRLFSSEAEILEALSQHDQIPRLLAYFEQDGEFYLAQDYIDGHPLSAELTAGDRWTEQEVIALLADVLPILDFVHARGAIHRDLKPDNLLRRREDQRLVLIDFGAVKRLRTEPAASQTVAIGTPGYMASEQAQGQPCFGSDLYALGVIALQALSGIPPQRFEYHPHTGEIVWDTNLGSPALVQFLRRLLAYHFRDRYASAREAQADLQALLAGAPLASPPPPPLSQQATLAVAGARRPTTQAVNPPASPPPRLQPAPFLSFARPLSLVLLFVITALVAFGGVFAGVYAWRNRTPRTARSPAPTPTQPAQPGWGNSWWDSINSSIQSVRSALSGEEGRCTVVATNGMNVRAQPSLEAERLGGVDNGTLLYLTGSQEQDWLEVREPLSGWVYHDPQLLTCTGLRTPAVSRSPEFPRPELESPAAAVRDRGQELLQDAQRRLESGDLQSALDLARSVPELSDRYRDAQQAIETWQGEWNRAQQAYDRAQEALKAGRWEDAIAHANAAVQNPYWRERLQELANRARQGQAAQPAPPSAPPSPRPSPLPTPNPPPPPSPLQSPSPSPLPTPTRPPSPPEPEPAPPSPLTPDPDPETAPAPRDPCCPPG